MKLFLLLFSVGDSVAIFRHNTVHAVTRNYSKKQDVCSHDAGGNQMIWEKYTLQSDMAIIL